MTQHEWRPIDFIERFRAMFKDWDRLRKTKECPHCHGTGLAPSSDGRTECGFCTKDGKET